MKMILIITCASFTAIVMIFALASGTGIAPEISRDVIVQLFAMTLTIAVIMFLAGKIEDRFDMTSLVLDWFIKVIICYAVVITEGSLFGMFPLEWKAFGYISPVLVPTIIATYIISYLTCAKWADAINKSIHSKK
jgi:hypothetical protein